MKKVENLCFRVFPSDSQTKELAAFIFSPPNETISTTTKQPGKRDAIT